MDWEKALPRFVIAASLGIAAYALLTPKVEPLGNLGKAEVLSGADMNGRPAALSDYSGKVVLVAFWATWCPGCREEIPMLKNLQEKMKDRNFTVLGVSVDEDLAAVAPFARSAGINYPVLQKPGPTAPDGWWVPGLPSAYLVGKDGALLRHYDGRATLEALTGDIKAATAL